MSAREASGNAVLSAQDRVVHPAPGIAQRGSMLTGPSLHKRRIPLVDDDLVIDVETEGDPPWVAPTAEKLGQLLTLRAGWDSYGAQGIKPECVVSAFEIALAVMEADTPPPAVVPTSCGGVQFEWHARGINLEIEIRSPALTVACYENEKTGVTWEDTVFDYSRIRLALRELARR